FMWLLMVPLLVLLHQPYWLIASFLVRTLFLYLTIYSANRRFGGHFKIWSVFLLDILFAIYYSVTGITALFSKKIKWS
ncbi:MAG: poly-beta-1,6-N-acetyl-D-glucosamine synthase, partial [Bacteroidota bacterium]